MSVVLQPISQEAGEALRAQRAPDGVDVASDYPTEFSWEVGDMMGERSALGPYFIQRADDGVVVGEIGGAQVRDGAMEIGYAVVRSCWGRGYATDAVRLVVDRARSLGGIARVVAHAPLDRPASGRVLEKAGFMPAGQREDEHDGQVMLVRRWELELG